MSFWGCWDPRVSREARFTLGYFISRRRRFNWSRARDKEKRRQATALQNKRDRLESLSYLVPLLDAGPESAEVLVQPTAEEDWEVFIPS